jgi:hypothetical protein
MRRQYLVTTYNRAGRNSDTDRRGDGLDAHELIEHAYSPNREWSTGTVWG